MKILFNPKGCVLSPRRQDITSCIKIRNILQYKKSQDNIQHITMRSETMTKQEYLKQYLNKWHEIEQRSLEIEQLRSRADKITCTITGVPYAGKGEGGVPAADKIMEFQKILEAEVLEAMDTRQQIEKEIEMVADPREQTVLKYRYINGYTIETIAELMDLSDRWIRIIHSKAIKAFHQDEKILPASC